jgi:predicted RNA-binding Zn-ribbon protein involved in translation (DUF1610 family)
MSDDCLRKACAICGDRITGGNLYCPNCKLCVRLFCGTKLVLAEGTITPTCPSCGNKLENPFRMDFSELTYVNEVKL